MIYDAVGIGYEYTSSLDYCDSCELEEDLKAEYKRLNDSQRYSPKGECLDSKLSVEEPRLASKVLDFLQEPCDSPAKLPGLYILTGTFVGLSVSHQYPVIGGIVGGGLGLALYFLGEK